MHLMMTDLPANTADYLFSVDFGPTDKLLVTAFRGREALNELFEFHIDLTSDDEVDPASVLGRPGILQIKCEGGTRLVDGIVRAFERRGQTARHIQYSAQVVPAHWLLSKLIGSRIFQSHNCPDMTVPGIITKVLTDAGMRDRMRSMLVRTYEPREYVVQYRESELNFISRLMEEEGIHYYFEHSEAGHVMVLADSPAANAPAPLAPELQFRSPTGLRAEHEHVYQIRDLHSVQIGSVRMSDFDFTRPPFDMRVEATGDARDDLILDDFPGNYVERATGHRHAEAWLDGFQAQRELLDMDVTARGLLPGYRFKLIEHSAAALNREYLVTSVVHTGRLPQSSAGDRVEGIVAPHYEAQVQAIPASRTYRPPMRTPRPTVKGSQTATVVGPRGEEIYTDKYGRVKVQFNWDPARHWDEKSSCWIRVSQAWAGGKYGAMFLPRVGHEVIVDFLEGDPDRPIITGRVYNGDLSTVWDLPKNKMRSGLKSKSTPQGDGANALIFDDTAGKEHVHLHSQQRMEITAEGNRIDGTGGDHDFTVGKNRRDDVEGYYEIDVGTDYNECVGGNRISELDGHYTLKIGGCHVETADAVNLKGDRFAYIEAPSITLRAGGNYIHVHSGGIDIVGQVVNINSGGNGKLVLETAPRAMINGAAAGSHVKHGYDVNYIPLDDSGNSSTQMSMLKSNPPTDDQKKTSWIEIELLNEAGQPWPNEPYEITPPEGEVIKGNLNDKGQAHVDLKSPGLCKISFPRLDLEAWRRA